MKFYSKVLLFGEYGIIKGARGLAIPFRGFWGELKKANSLNEVEQNLRLDRFCDYLEGSSLLSNELNLDAFREDISEGLYFDSNIPLGHGIGSSGALCASIFYEYAKSFKRKNEYTEKELMLLKDLMALMESFYHGSSSGLDCLVSLLDRPVQIEGRNKISLIERPELSEIGYFYLFDSNINRKTSPLVHKFLQKFDESKDFRDFVDRFILHNDTALSSLYSKDVDAFHGAFRQISKEQYIHFSDMIPDTVKMMWLEGIETGRFETKFCGAGGGGFFLVYSLEKLNNCNANFISLI